VNAGSRRPIFDGHNDALLKLAPFATDDLQRFLDGGTSGHIDLPRALNGGSVTMSCQLPAVLPASSRHDAFRSMMSRMSRGQHLLQKIATLSF